MWARRLARDRLNGESVQTTILHSGSDTRSRLLDGLLLRRQDGQATETLALTVLADHGNAVAASSVEALKAIQSSDGLWPAFPAADDGCPYATALATYALHSVGDRSSASAKGIRALLDARPREASLFWRWKFRFADRQVRFNPDKYGWGWVRGTISWVIPTAFAILALRRAEASGHASALLDERLGSALGMLADRECAGGGWNAGNAVVFGVPLKPHIDATAVALLALRDVRNAPTSAAALEWILTQLPCASAYSQAWAMIAVDAYRNALARADDVLAIASEHLTRLLCAEQRTAEPTTLAVATIALELPEYKNPFVVMEQ
jgi:hypothetical protein